MITEEKSQVEGPASERDKSNSMVAEKAGETFGETLEAAAELDDHHRQRSSITVPLISASFSAVGSRSLHKTITTTTTTTTVTPSTTNHLPIRSKAAADLSAMQTTTATARDCSQNQNSTQEDPEPLAEEPVEASLAEEDNLIEEEKEEEEEDDEDDLIEEEDDDADEDRHSSAAKKVVQDDQRAEVIVKQTTTTTTTNDFERKQSTDTLDYHVAADTLTSLSAHVDEASQQAQVSELPEQTQSNAAGEQQQVGSAGKPALDRQLSSATTSTTCNSHEKQRQQQEQHSTTNHQEEDSPGRDPFTLLRHLMQKRDELKQADKRLFNIMTQYLLQMDMSAAASPPEVLWSPLGGALPAAHLPHQLSAHQYQRHLYQFEPNWYGHHYEYLAACDFYRQMAANQNHNSTECGINHLNVAMDLSSGNNSSKGSRLSFSSSLATGLRSNSSSSLDTLPTGGCSAEINNSGSSTGNPFNESFKLVERKTSSVNLKKSRLLADLNAVVSSDSNGREISREHVISAHRPDRQSSPLNLLKRYCSPPSENSFQSTTSRRTSSASTSVLTNGLDAIATPHHRFSLTSSGLDNYLFAPSVASSMKQQQQQQVEEGVDYALLNPQHKKFRRLSQLSSQEFKVHEDLQHNAMKFVIPEASAKTDHIGSSGLDAHFSAAAAQLVHQQHVQQQQKQHLLVSEMLIDQQQQRHQYHSKQLRASSTPSPPPPPASLTLMTTLADSSRNQQAAETSVLSFRQNQHHHAGSFDSRSSTVAGQDSKCFRPFTSDRATAYILATMQHNEGTVASKDNTNSHLSKQSSTSLQVPQTMHSVTNGVNDDNLHTVTITPTKMGAQNSLELVRATIGKDHQLVPVQEPLMALHHQHDALRPRMAYRCHVCGSGFEDRHRLQQHLSIHLNLHPSWFEEKTIKETMAQYEAKRGDYLCSMCNLRHETTAEFDKHMQLHGDKPHRCDLCDQDNKLVSFRYYRQLLTHLRSHCFLYSCRFAPDCKQTSNRKDYLKLHILKHHLNNKLPEQYTICCH